MITSGFFIQKDGFFLMIFLLTILLNMLLSYKYYARLRYFSIRSRLFVQRFFRCTVNLGSSNVSLYFMSAAISNLWWLPINNFRSITYSKVFFWKGLSYFYQKLKNELLHLVHLLHVLNFFCWTVMITVIIKSSNLMLVGVLYLSSVFLGI